MGLCEERRGAAALFANKLAGRAAEAELPRGCIQAYFLWRRWHEHRSAIIPSIFLAAIANARAIDDKLIVNIVTFDDEVVGRIFFTELISCEQKIMLCEALSWSQRCEW